MCDWKVFGILLSDSWQQVISWILRRGAASSIDAERQGWPASFLAPALGRRTRAIARLSVVRRRGCAPLQQRRVLVCPVAVCVCLDAAMLLV